jgi:hypothetical protein
MAVSFLLTAAFGRLAAGGFVQPIQIPFPEAFRLCGLVTQIFFGIIIKRFTAGVGAEVIVVLSIGGSDVAAVGVHLHAAYRIDHCAGDVGCRVQLSSPKLFSKAVAVLDMGSVPTFVL